MMNNVISLFPLREKLKELTDALVGSVPRAIDYALSAERQLWRILSSDNHHPDDPKVYELALMVASGNLEDGIRHLTEVKKRVDEALVRCR